MNENCPNCGQVANLSFSRLIADSCGHKKCRICLLQEADGCKACIQFKNAINCDSGMQKSTDILEGSYPEKLSTASEPLQNGELAGIRDCADLYEEEMVEIVPEMNLRNSKRSTSKVKRKKAVDRTHITTIPGDPEQYKCTICNKVFLNKKGQCYHDVCLTGVRPYQCSVCERTFVKKSHHEYHERVHSGLKPFECQLCKKAYPQKNKLNRHMLSHDPEKKFSCSKCGKKYSKKEDVKAHMSSHSDLKPHICDVCGKSFRMPANLRRHILIHSNDRPHVCNHCGKGFKDKSLLARHRRTHGKERPYCCAHCNRVFIAKSELVRHIATHSDVKPFSCHLCQTDFRRKDNLNRHIRHHHSEESETQRRKEAESRRKREEEKKEMKLKKNSGEKKISFKDKLKNVAPVNSAESTKRIALIVNPLEKNTESQNNQRKSLIINFTPVIRAPGESSNAVPVINRPMSMKRPEEKIESKKQVLTFTQPIPCAAAVVINQRIEEKLYLQSSATKNSLFFRENSNQIDSNLPASVLPSLRHHPPVRAVPITKLTAEGRVADPSVSPPKNLTFVETKAPIPRDNDADEGQKSKKCTIVMDEKINVRLKKSEGTNCVSTIIRNTMSINDKKDLQNEKKNQQVHWRRRTAEILKPHLN